MIAFLYPINIIQRWISPRHLRNRLDKENGFKSKTTEILKKVLIKDYVIPVNLLNH